MSAVRPIRLVAKADGGARTAGPIEDADRPQLTLIRGYKTELAPIIAAYGEVEVLIRPATPIPEPEPPPKPRLPTNWQDLDGWRAVLRYARTLEHRRWVVGRWAQAVGGDVHDGVLHLPPDLSPGLALAELKTHARIAGLEVAA